MYQLVVTHPFAAFKVGDHIVDPALVAQYSASHPEYVVRKLLEDAPSSTSNGLTSSPSVPQLKPIV